MTVHAVIVNWNGGAATLRCLGSVAALDNPPAVVHVVDNGSTDGSAEAVEAAHPAVRVHRTGRNLGFAAGANVGIRAALSEESDFVLLLNNDATLETGALARLVDAAKRRPDLGLYGPKILSDTREGRLWCCGVSLGFAPNLCRLRGHGRRDRGRFDREETVDALTGCVLLVSRRVFEAVGLLPEAYFVYVEDADFCAAARAAGFGCLYVPSARAEHRAASSTGGGYSRGRKYLTAHGSVLYLRRRGTPGLWLGFVVFDVLAFPIVLLVEAFRGRGAAALAKGRGTVHGLLGRPPDLRILGSVPEVRARRA